MSNYKTLIEKNLDELAEIVSKEHGKTLSDAKGSVTRGLEVVEFACGIPHLLKGEFSQNVGTNIDSWSVRQPLVFVLELHHSIFLQWFQCGCFQLQLLVEIHLF